MVGVFAHPAPSRFPARHLHARPAPMVVSLAALHPGRALVGRRRVGSLAGSPWHRSRWPPHSPPRRHPRQATRRRCRRKSRRCRLRRPGPRSTSRVVLPLDAPAYARAAEAVRAGFVAGADAAGGRTTYVVIPHGEDGVLDGVRGRATSPAPRSSSGRWSATTSRSSRRCIPNLPWTLALNQSEDAASGRRSMFTFSLAVESDARTIARRMRDDAAQYVAIVGADTPLMKRFAVAFATEWLQGGGNAPNSVPLRSGTRSADACSSATSTRSCPTRPCSPSTATTRRWPSLTSGPSPAFASGLVFDRKSDDDAARPGRPHHRGDPVARDARRAGIREVCRGREFAQRVAGAALRARPRRVSHRAGADRRPAGPIRPGRRYRPHHAGRRPTIRARRAPRASTAPGSCVPLDGGR